MSKVFVTGATGFIGKNLIFQLLEEGHEVYALCRIRGTQIATFRHPHLYTIYGDLQDLEKMDPLPTDIDAAYYLVHSMAEKLPNLLENEEKTAKNFIKLANRTACRQIIYLGGIIDEGSQLSAHLLSRRHVEEVLKTGKCPLTVLRASIIIGAGSASFEIIRDLVEKLPIMIAPKWVKTLCQPIAVV
ncbi:MAG: NAD(P)H-binding protein, partial [Verrucomicrobia bacterium]|nr:NAD(P)H-binding protein [Verrucomicrobiota bacterium]